MTIQNGEYLIDKLIYTLRKYLILVINISFSIVKETNYKTHIVYRLDQSMPILGTWRKIIVRYIKN